jgi:uncharacterized protein
MPSGNVLIVHGTEASPNDHWFPWLRQELLARDFQVSIPAFPTPNNQNYTSWDDAAQKAMDGWRTDRTILIGHSTGAAYVLRKAAQTPCPYLAVMAVCPFEAALGHPVYDPLNKSFVDPPTNWENVKVGARHIHLYGGDNDPYIPRSQIKSIAKKLDVVPQILVNGGHLNTDSNTLTFPTILAQILAYAH